MGDYMPRMLMVNEQNWSQFDVKVPYESPAWQARRQSRLAADIAATMKDERFMAGDGGSCGRGHTSDAATNDRDAASIRRGQEARELRNLEWLTDVGIRIADKWL